MKLKENKKLYNKEFYQNREQSKISMDIVVPVLLELINPKSVIDVGCGNGTWLRAFKDNGVDEIMGLDGEYVDVELLKIPKDNFFAIDLTLPIKINKKYDLVLSLEVAEHLPEENAHNFVESLTYLGDIILFSAAIPYQGGVNHINEQWPDYWFNLFLKKGFIGIDIIRNKIWNNDKVAFWYRQNMFIFVNKEKISQYQGLIDEIDNKSILSIVHPELYLYKCNINNISAKLIVKDRLIKISKKYFQIFHRIKALIPWSLIFIRFKLRGHSHAWRIFTHLTAQERLLLYWLALKLPKGSQLLEVGSYLGASSSFLAAAAKEIGGGAKLHCVDTWRNEGMSEGPRDTYMEFKKNTKDYNSIIYPYRGESSSIANEFKGELDFIFIDGDHSYEGCRADILAWTPHLKSGGIIVFHDYKTHEGVRRAVDELIKPIQRGDSHVFQNIFYAYL